MNKILSRPFLALLLLLSSHVHAGTWTLLNNTPTFGPGVVAPLLMTDGSVMVLNANSGTTGEIWKLVPDNTGSYVNGTWTQLASLPTGYAPLFFACAVLPDGRVIYEGGEYNAGVEAFTDMGAIYDPVANTWTSVTAPSFFLNGIGDASSVILNDGTFMLQNPFYLLQPNNGVAALLDAANLTWTQTGAGKSDSNDEEGWTLLPDGTVLTIDCYVNAPRPAPADRTNTEVYDPVTGTWSSAGNTVASLVGPVNFEAGPNLLLPNGIVFAPGATGLCGLYNTKTGVWSAGPNLPVTVDGQMACQDAPAALLPNGNALFAACVLSDAPNGDAPTHVFEFNGTSYTQQPDLPDFANLFASQFMMMVLPTGQILLTCVDSSTVAIYTPSDTSYNPKWAPKICRYPKKVVPGQTYKIKGRRFNGMSQAGMFGDDYQGATNYPLVRITNKETGNVVYCRTHDHSFMGVASNRTVSTFFDVPADIDLGKSVIEVVANGIPSHRKCIRVVESIRDTADNDDEDSDEIN